MGRTILTKGGLTLLCLVFLYPNETKASYDFRLAIALDSTKMTTRQEFKDQITLVKKVVTKVMDTKSIEYAIGVYTVDTNKIFKNFNNDTTINLSNIQYLDTHVYGFDPKQLFALKFNARPDCLWFIRNSENYTHPECNITYAPMGYKQPVAKIGLRYGREIQAYLRDITRLDDLISNGIQINASIDTERNFLSIVNSILLHCQKYQPSPITITPTAVLVTSSPSTQHTTEKLMTSTLTSLTHSLSHDMPGMRTTSPTTPSINSRPAYGNASIAVATTTQLLFRQSSSLNTASVTPTASVSSSSGQSIDKLRQEYEDFLDFKAEQLNLSCLSCDDEFLTFVNRSSRLLKSIHVLDAGSNEKVSYGWRLSVQLENTCIDIARTMIEKGMTEKILEAYTDNLVVRLSLVNISVFSGYEFGDVGVEEGTIKIPLEVFKKENALAAIVVMILDPVKPFTDGTLIDGKSNTTLAGKIIVVDVLPRPSKPLDRPVTIQVATKPTMEGSEANCVFWDPTLSGWSTDGCSVTKSNENITECQCNHMTHYAVLMSLDDKVIPKNHHQVMTMITYIGCSLSIMGIFLTIITFFCLPVLKSERTRIHCNLCAAIGVAQTLFLAAGSEELTRNTVACKLFAAVMLYFFISVFTWMLVEGIHLYQMIIVAFISRPMMKFYYALGWGFPAMIVIVATAIAYHGYGTPDFCWVSLRGGTIWAFTGPAACIILANMFVLVSVLRLRVKLDISNDALQVAKTGARVSIVLLPLLGMTWIFGFFSVIPGFSIVFQYLFAITNSLQGLMVFVFHCVGNSEVRKEFIRKTAQWNFRKSFSSTNTTAMNKVEPISMEIHEFNHKKD